MKLLQLPGILNEVMLHKSPLYFYCDLNWLKIFIASECEGYGISKYCQYVSLSILLHL